MSPSIYAKSVPASGEIVYAGRRPHPRPTRTGIGAGDLVVFLLGSIVMTTASAVTCGMWILSGMA